MNNKQKNESPLIWIICIVLFLAIAGGAYAFLSSRLHASVPDASGQETKAAAAKADDQTVSRLTCSHPSFENGVCTVCGWQCTEHQYENGACRICGSPCPHDFQDSVCSLCGLTCTHETWTDGFCDTCGYACTHPSHREEDACCIVCGQKQYHEFHNGICSICGGTPVFYTDPLPESFFEPIDHAGTVIRYEYRTRAWANPDMDEYEKALNVYLPYGYDASQPYDVLVLIHGGGGDENSWLVDEQPYGDTSVIGRYLFDNMIEQKVCRPFIIVTPATNTIYNTGVEAGIFQMREELRDFILPYIVETYSTYAEDSSLESISAAREHFALGGFSNGALCVFEAGFQYNFDLFGSYAAFSGDYEPWKTASAIRNGSFTEFPITCFFAGAGTEDDWQQEYSKSGFDLIVEDADRLTEGENAFYVDVSSGHDWGVWFTDIWNAMQVMFQY